MKNLAIDAHNIRSGGGLLYLKKILENADPKKYGFDKVFVWSTKETLKDLPKKNWLIKKNNFFLIQKKKKLIDFSLILRTYWHIFEFKKEAEKNNCNTAFFPGGINFSGFLKSVIINLNFLPFDNSEIKRFNFSLIYLRLKFLKPILIKSIENSKGVILLTSFFQKKLKFILKKKKKKIIGFGVEKSFFLKRKPSHDIKQFSKNNPFIIGYISSIFPYKNHLKLIKIIHYLQTKNHLPIKLVIIGSGYKPTENSIKNYLKIHDIKKNKILLYGFVSDKKIKILYKKKIHLKIFPSSCEAFPNILLEAGAAGLPILCNKKKFFTEIFRNNINYFNLNNHNDLKNTIMDMVLKKKLRKLYSERIQKFVKKFKWTKCSNKTFQFLSTI